MENPQQCDQEQLRADLKALLVKRLRLHGVRPDSIGDTEPLVAGPLGLDSIDMLDLALAVEDTYGVQITDEQIGQQAFRTISALAEFVHETLRVARDPHPSDA